MQEKEFNLIDESWIRVIDNNCRITERSMLDVFEHAQEFVDLSGELPTQDVAVMRMLLAVLHTTFSRYSFDGEPAEINDPDNAFQLWSKIWENGRFPMKPIKKYLDSQLENFWLFHPVRPFYQSMAAKNGTEYLIPKLNGELSESNNKARLFKKSCMENNDSMSYSEAARWLLNLNGFDDTSSKPSQNAKKEQKQTGIKKGSPGAGWLGKLGLVVVAGDNLFETLMLNFILVRNEKTSQKECPAWENDSNSAVERNKIPFPDNLSALYTLQSRRILLNRSEKRVTGYNLIGGDFFEKENAFIEPMTMWKKDSRSDIWTPKRHDDSKQFWREFSNVFTDAKDNHRPEIINWIQSLCDSENGCLPNNLILKTKIASVKYGDKDFFVDNIFSDSLSLHASLISNLNIEWQNKVVKAIECCGEIAKQVGILAKNIYCACGRFGRKGSRKCFDWQCKITVLL